ncbi:MAG: spondin domain-containing protein [Microcystaceae cyanobacterium]
MNKLAYLLAASGIIAFAPSAQAAVFQVTIENLAPQSGVRFTPVWVGFHNGSFDSYNGGLSSQLGLELLAEDGNNLQFEDDFAKNRTYIDNSGGTPLSATLSSADAGFAQVGTRVQGRVGSAPIAPGQSASQLFTVTEDSSNQFFSYASMILPSNDYFIANGNPTEIDVSSLFNTIGESIVFNIGTTINDAGTEVNDFNTSAGNVLFGLSGGQTGPQQGANENGVVANVTATAPFDDFDNQPGGFDFSPLNFNDTNLYPNGVARVTITSVQVPEASGIKGLFLLGILGLIGGINRRFRS